jgi:hypothetical protein
MKRPKYSALVCQNVTNITYGKAAKFYVRKSQALARCVPPAILTVSFSFIILKGIFFFPRSLFLQIMYV